jgi:ubiquinone/menaquinone biosynthesis C-methylase UbiE
MSNQRMMTFIKSVDTPGNEKPNASHLFCFDFSHKYIKNKNILNIGSWTGPFEELAIHTVKKITSTDIEEKALSILKKRYPKVDCYKAFSHNLPFKDKSFDVVTFWAVIEHIPIGFELATLKEIRRVLKPNGYLFLSTMNNQIWSNILDPAYWLVGHRHYSKIQLIDMLANAGFTTQKTVVHGSFITAFDAILFYFFKHILRMRKPYIPWIQKIVDRDFMSKGFYEITMRAKAKNLKV